MVDAKAEDHTLAVVPGQNGIGELDEEGAPKTIEGYMRLNRITAATDKNLTNIKFGDPEKTIQVRSPSEAAELLPLYLYDPETNTFTNQKTGVVYTDIEGTYTAKNGEKLIPGYSAVVGTKNFVQFITAPGLRGPLATIVTWNFIFAFMSLFLTFSVGLLISIIYGDPKFKGKKLLRSLLLIPYTIPSLITILIWRGMLNPDLGIINRVLNNVFGFSPDWFNVPWLARAAILIVNTWLGYPYWMLVTSGALQSIPSDIYEAAQVDGATGWQRFWNITLPLLLVSVGPLMISSFIFNFNNFNLLYQRRTAHSDRDDPGWLHGYHYQLCIQPGFRQRSRCPVRICLGNIIGSVRFDCDYVAGAVQAHEYVGGGWRKCLKSPNPSSAPAS